MPPPPPLPLGCELRASCCRLSDVVCSIRIATTNASRTTTFTPNNLNPTGPINNARLVQDEVQAFQMLISDAIIEEIVRYTNIHIANVQSKYQIERHAKNVTKTELMAFLGLLFLSGVKRARRTNFRDLWATDGSGIEIFRACISYNRFLFLLSAIRFDDKSNRN